MHLLASTRSVVELAIGEIVMLFRGVYDKCQKLHDGIWDKVPSKLRNPGQETRIIGYGKIGSQLSSLAESMGMQVFYYDGSRKVSARKC
jgi:D-3-phosphoglycerate dehydrogenase